jgi:acyl-CoA thioesterase
MISPANIVAQMLVCDDFSTWLGIKIQKVIQGEVVVSLEVKEIHTNGFKIAHGGICYSLADSCLAFVANSYGYKAVSVETSMSHVVKVYPGDNLIASSKLVYKGNSSAVFIVEIINQEKILVAHFKGTVRISKELW